MSKPVTNDQLHRLLVEAGYERAHATLARQVNRMARDRHGMTMKYDAASVYWWLRGRRPEPPVPTLIAAVLARRLGRQICVEDLGFGEVGPEIAQLGLDFARSTGESQRVVTELWRHVVLRRDFLTAAPFVPTAAAQAGWCWSFDPADQNVAHSGGRAITGHDIAALRATQHQFLDLDRRFGGGHARRLLVVFLHREVTPLLHGTYTDTIGRQLHAATAELTCQAAFMSYDNGEHGLAQRYFIQALRLAKAANDDSLGAHILANLSTQAVFLNHPGEAVRLARAAVDRARHRAPAAVMARLYAAEATAHAIATDEASCTAALDNAERAMHRTHSGEAPGWAGYFTSAHLAGAAVRCLRDLGRTTHALRYADDALRLDDGSTRTRALHTALVASLHTTSNPEHAADLGMRSLDTAATLRSHRVTDRVNDLGARLAAHTLLPQVATFLDRAREFRRAGTNASRHSRRRASVSG